MSSLGLLIDSGTGCYTRKTVSEMIDLHSHVLPGVDDGARSEEIAVEMCRMALEDGTTHLVASPHSNYTYGYNREQHQERLEKLQALVPEIELILGCDFHLSYENIEDALAHPGRYNIGRSRALLVEFSDFNIPPNVIDIFFQLQNAGYRLIITHPERNAILLRHPERVREMVDCGAFVQLTANSITGFWGKPAQRYCEALLKEEMVHIIGSDAHDLKRRPPILSQARKAVARIIGQSGAQRLVQENPAALLHDQDLEF